MAREIVITSVPRGVKLGRTGFQVAMQTAGMRDDVAAVLEKMAGYRHLSAGAGANPVCYFHRVARTVAGQMHVLGRIVDAGVDFSNRSNKLAHMVVLEAADLSAVAAASPAAVLVAIEGRLASTWPGGPEERRQPFPLAGIPPSQPVPCGLWQQVMGDAGWAGVIAERAVRNEPTLIIGPDSSPASCRRMLALFAEALAIVPPARRWAVTFDTTTLVADGVLWRGTYAGSPESQVAQPGVLIVNLSRPQPLPQNLQAGDLVQVARLGAPALPAGGRPVPPGGVPTPPGMPVHGNAAADTAKTAARGEPTGRPGAPPPAPFDENEWEDEPLGGSRRKRGGGGGLLVAGIAFAVLLLLGIAAVGGFFVWKNAIAPGQAMKRIQDFADGKDKSKAPTLEDVCTALRIDQQSPEATAIKANLAFLVDALASTDVKSGDVKDADALTNMLNAVKAVTTIGPAVSKSHLQHLLKGDVDDQTTSLIVALHPGPFTEGYGTFQSRVRSIQELLDLARKEKTNRNGATIDDRLWELLVERAIKKEPDRDYKEGRATFIKSVDKEGVKSLDALITTVVESSPATEEPKPDGAPSGNGSEPGNNPPSSAGPEPSPDEAFKALRDEIAAFRRRNTTIPVEADKGTTLFEINPTLAKALAADVVVGFRDGVDAGATRDGPQRTWKVMIGQEHVATIDLTGGKVVVKGGDEAAWNKHWQAIRFMPIAFRRPGQKLSKDDWVVLSQPESKTLVSEETLFDLVCRENGSVPLPDGVLRGGEAAPWATREWPDDKESPRIQLKARGAEATLEVVAHIDGQDYVLSEQLSIDAKEKVIRRTAASWSSMRSRLDALDGKQVNPVQEKYKLGFKDGKLGFKDGKLQEIKSREDSLELLVHAIIFDHFSEQKPKTKDSTHLLAVWSPKINEQGITMKGKFDDKKLSTLADLRLLLQKYIASEDRGFGKERWVEYRKKHPKPPEPGDPPPGPPEKRDHDAKQTAWNKWRNDGSKQVLEDAANTDLLHKYLATHVKDDRPEKDKNECRFHPERSAIYVLLELDGMIVAKVYRAELETLLGRVPVAGLFKGEVSEQWKFKGINDPVPVGVPVATLQPADLLPPPAKSQDSDAGSN